MRKIVADPGILAAALRSATGASNALLREAFYRRMTLLISPPLFAEYDFALKTPEHRLTHGRMIEAVDRFLAALACLTEAVSLTYLWRPRLSDPIDEILLETAVTGQADTIVTLIPKRLSAIDPTLVRVATPRQLLKDLR